MIELTDDQKKAVAAAQETFSTLKPPSIAKYPKTDSFVKIISIFFL